MQQKRLLIGWESADWKIILPMIDAGKLPNIQKLSEKGAIGRIIGVQPDSPATVWTSVVTGKYPHQHQILADYEALPEGKGLKPVSRLGRNSKPLWQILGDKGYRSLVINCPASHPVESLQGVMVSPHFIKPPAANDTQRLVHAESVYPADLISHFSDLRVHPTELVRDDLLPFVPDFDALYQANDARLVNLALILAETATIQAVTTGLMQTQDWDFAVVYFNGIAQVSQLFMNYHPPRLDFVSEQDFNYFKQVVEMMYIFHDALLGVLLALAGADASVTVLSTSGFHAGNGRTNADENVVPKRKELGMFILSDSRVKADTLVYQTSILDITPTLLHLYELPVGEDMAGKVLESALIKPPVIQKIPTWETENKTTYNPLDNAVLNAETATNAQVNLIQELIADLHLKQAQSFISARQPHLAIPILNRLWTLNPTHSRCGNTLMSCYVGIERVDLARKVFEQMFQHKKQFAPVALQQWKQLEARDPQTLSPAELRQKQKMWKQSRINLSGMAYLHAWLLHAENQLEEALKVAQRADENKVYNRLGLYKLRAECYLRLKRLEEAQTEYEKVLKIEADSADAYLGLARVAFRQRQYQLAVDNAARCIGLRYLSPRAHLLYGISMIQLEQPAKALDALKIAARQAPAHSAVAYQRIAILYRNVFNDIAQADYYWQKAKEVLASNKSRKKQQNIEIEEQEWDSF